MLCIFYGRVAVTALEQGFIVMFLGMGIVFLLLVLLVFAMKIMSRVVAYSNTFWPEPHDPSVPLPSNPKEKTGLDKDEALAIVIALAMHAKKKAAQKSI